jgi:hypothetical protein
MTRPSENALQKLKSVKAQSKLRITASSALIWKKKSIVYEALMFLRSLDVLYEVWILSRSINILLYEA